MSAPNDVSRRNFLRGALTAGIGAAAAVVASGGVAAVVEEAEKPAEPPAKKGYRLTPHILDYYKSAS